MSDYEYRWIDVPKQCGVCAGTGVYRSSPCGKCNGHGEYMVARLMRRKLDAAKGVIGSWMPVGRPTDK